MSHFTEGITKESDRAALSYWQNRDQNLQLPALSSPQPPVLPHRCSHGFWLHCGQAPGACRVLSPGRGPSLHWHCGGSGTRPHQGDSLEASGQEGQPGGVRRGPLPAQQCRSQHPILAPSLKGSSKSSSGPRPCCDFSRADGGPRGHLPTVSSTPWPTPQRRLTRVWVGTRTPLRHPATQPSIHPPHQAATPSSPRLRVADSMHLEPEITHPGKVYVGGPGGFSATVSRDPHRSHPNLGQPRLQGLQWTHRS